MAKLAAMVIATLALGTGAGRAESLPPIKQVVSFGDSLTDAGTYQFRNGTAPGLTYAQHLSLRFGQALPLSNEHLDNYDDAFKGVHGQPGPGGLNYGEGGAKADSAYSASSNDPEGLPISTAVQLQHYIAQHQRFTPEQLVTFWIGTNDAGYHYDPGIAPQIAKDLRDDRALTPDTMAAERARVEQAADAAARTVKDILSNGAKRVVVLKLFDLGITPWYRTGAARAFGTDMSDTFNKRLVAKLPDDSEHVLVVDTQAFLQELLDDKDKYGFKHGINEDACRQDDQDYCFPGSWKEPDADRTFIFAAAVHLTTKTNELLADYVLRKIAASPLK